MKHKVLKPFRDKYTNKIYEAGSIEEFSDQRVREVVGYIGPHYLEKVITPKTKVVKNSKTTSDESEK